VSLVSPKSNCRRTLASAASGIHDIEAGQTARITFGDLDEIRCIAQPSCPAGGLGGSNLEHPIVNG
jgi:hypothetical protein